MSQEFALRPITGRGYEEYLEWLNLSDVDLQGRVLDLGAGLGAFAHDAEQQRVEVYSLEPELLSGAIRDVYNDRPSDVAERAVAAQAEHLPFRDESFDTIVSLFAVPLGVGRDMYGQTYGEAHRVLRKGGKAYFTPLNKTDIQHTTPYLDAMGINYMLNAVETPFGTIEEWKRLTLIKP